MSTVTAPSFVQTSWLVAEREIRTRIRSKSFLITTGILLLLILGSVLFSGFAAKNATDTPVAAVGSSAEALAGIPGFAVTEVPDQAAAEKLITDGTVDAAIMPSDSSGVGLAVIGNTEVPQGLISALSITPEVLLLDPDAMNSMIAYFAAIGFGVIFFMSAMTFGPLISQSVVEEKQTRIVEILMSAVPVRALMTGKIVGNSLLAFMQIVAIAALATVGLSITGQTDLLGMLGAPLLWFVGFFAFGFVLLAALFAAVGAMVSRQEDLSSAMTPVTMLIMLPYFAIIFLRDNALVMTIMSYVPFSAPVGMPVRLFLGTAEWWEPILSLAILIVSTALTIALSARIYSNSLLRMGSRVTWGQALRG